jgi:hypothetical protein
LTMLDDYLSLVYFAATWIQPAVWAGIMENKSRLLSFTLRVGAIVALASFIPLYSAGFVQSHGEFTLFYFYAAMGVALSYLLPWGYTRNLAVSALIVFVASLYWEIPIIITNALARGPEWDWVLHVLKLYFAFWLRDAVGWNVDAVNVVKLGVGLGVAWMWGASFPITGTTAEWNSVPYLAIRFIAVAIIFSVLKREKMR